MKKPSYPISCKWIADNDDPDEMDESIVACQVSVLMVADIYGIEPLFVAKSVVSWREKEL